MAKHKLSLEERVRGVRRALASPHTPSQLRSGLQQQLELLKKKLQKKRPNRKREPRVGLLDWLRL